MDSPQIDVGLRNMCINNCKTFILWQCINVEISFKQSYRLDAKLNSLLTTGLLYWPWLVDWHLLSVQYRGTMRIFTVRSCLRHASQVLLFTGDRRMPRWQYFFFFFLFSGRLFVISHLMLTCKLLRATVTIADDSFVLSPLRLLMLWFSWNPLWLRHKWDRERKHRLENTLKAPALEPVVSLEAVGDFGQNNCYCSASSKCVAERAQIPGLHSYMSTSW